MRHYVIDEFVQEGFSDESVNVNCVLSWRLSRSNLGDGRQRLLIVSDDWFFDSDHKFCRSDSYQRVLQRLRSIA